MTLIKNTALAGFFKDVRKASLKTQSMMSLIISLTVELSSIFHYSSCLREYAIKRYGDNKYLNLRAVNAENGDAEEEHSLFD
jgi:hypothetical protein